MQDQQADEAFTLPEHFEQMAQQDKETYQTMQKKFDKDRHQRNTRTIDNIHQMLEYIEAFTGGDSIKSLVCGFYRYKDKILINPRQLTNLIGCCKSQTNNLLKQAGYETLPERPQVNELSTLFGTDVKDPTTKQWSYRKVPSKSFTVQTCSNVPSAFWPYKITQNVPEQNNNQPEPVKEVPEQYNNNPQSSLDPYDSQPAQDTEIHFSEQELPEQVPLTDYDDITDSYGVWNQYEPDDYTYNHLYEVDL